MSRSTIRLLRATVMAIAGPALALAFVVAPASADTVSPASLSAAGWNCFPAPPFIVPPRIVCANPGLGHPVPGTAADRPSYTFVEFTPDGALLGIETLIRGDLYRGQPCGPSGDPYIFRPAIGYYACLRS
jgi:hypothetical protein